MRGKFIVIEGLDGSGKSTQTQKLQKAFGNRNIDTEYIHFPRTDKESDFYGPLLKKFLKGEFGSNEYVDPYFVALLFAGDRKNAKKWINNTLEEGKWIIADRYVLSNIAFQGAKLKTIDEKKKIASWILNTEFELFELPKPDLTIFLHTPFTFTEKNLKSNRKGADRDYLDGKADIHESSMQFQHNVYDMYKMMLKMPETKLCELQIEQVGDNIPPADEIHARLFNLIENKL